MNKQDFINEISQLRPGSSFLVLKKYRNSEGEEADHNIIFHFSYENALKASIAEVEKFEPQNALQVTAKNEVLKSWKASLQKLHEVAPVDIDDAYTRFFCPDTGKLIDGVKLHTESGKLHIFGLANLKRVIIPVAYKQVNHRPLTIEKRKLMRMGKVHRFRQFIVTPQNVERIAVRGLQLLPPEENNM